MRRRRALVALLLVAVLGVVTVTTGVGGRLAREVGRHLTPAGPGGGGAAPTSLLLAWSLDADDGGRSAFVLMGGSDDRDGAGAMLIPGGTQVEVPSLGSRTLTEVLATGDPDRVELAVENVLGVDVARTVVLDAASWRAALEPTTPFEIRPRERLRLADRELRPVPLLVDTGEAASLLTGSGIDQPELDHLVTVHAVLEGWLAALRGPATEASTRALAGSGTVDDETAELLARDLDFLAGRSVTFDLLDVTALSIPGGERFVVDDGAVADEVRSLFPELLHVSGDRVTVEIRNGTGQAGVAAAASRLVVPAGGRVVLTGNAASLDVDRTLVIVGDERHEAPARSIAAALGTGSLRFALEPVSVADIVVVLGSDFRSSGV